MNNEPDEIELWLLSPETTLEDLERIANADD